MRVMDVLTAVKQGARVMVTMPDRADRKKKYNLTDGTEVSHDQFDRLKPFLAADDPGLMPDAEPLSYRWGG